MNCNPCFDNCNQYPRYYILNCIKDTINELEYDLAHTNFDPCTNYQVDAAVRKNLPRPELPLSLDWKHDPIAAEGITANTLSNEVKDISPTCTCYKRNGLQDQCERCNAWPAALSPGEVTCAAHPRNCNEPIVYMDDWAEKISKKCDDDVLDAIKNQQHCLPGSCRETQTELALIKGIPPDTKLCPHCYQLFNGGNF